MFLSRGDRDLGVAFQTHLTPPLETPGHSQVSLGQSLVGSLLLSPGRSLQRVKEERVRRGDVLSRAIHSWNPRVPEREGRS